MAKKMEKVTNVENKRAILSDVKEINFDKIYFHCDERVNGKISEKELIKYLDSHLVVRDYISLSTKKNMIALFYSINDDVEVNDFSDMTYLFEIYSILFMLFAYTNIRITSDEINEDNYDMCMMSGLVKYIQDKCGYDYNIFYNMVLNSMTFKNHQIVHMLGESLNMVDLQDFSAQTQRALSEVDEDKLSLLKTIIEYNNPTLQKINDTIYNVAESIKTKE